MSALLLYPPFADPTQPYVSLPTLKGHLRARDLDARVVDLNIEAVHHLLAPASIERLAVDLEQAFAELDRAASLDFFAQLRYQALAAARGSIDDLASADPSPVEVFQTQELFDDPVAYSRAQVQCDTLLAALSAVHHPYRYDFNTALHAWLPWGFDALDAYADGRRSPLDAFYRAFDFGQQQDGAPDFIGLSVVFPSQLPETFYLCRVLRERFPEAFLAVGGPTLHQAVVHMPERVKHRWFEWVDGVALYEGEATIEQLLPRTRGWRELARTDPAAAAAALATVPNLLTQMPDPKGPPGTPGQLRLGPSALTDLRTAAPPDYTDLDLDRYLAPSRRLLYAPTRGCYWDKCSFCYYGLSDTATASYREVPPERAAADLKALSQQHQTRNFYISCDVLAPAYAVRLADALIDADAGIRWSSDLKIEKYYTPERCQRLHDSGLRAAAFGIESGSDRILTLMRKGCDRATMTAVNRSFHRAGVATEWMTFTGHPDESADEALMTVDWIAEQVDAVALFIVGEFGLQPGSHIAKNPDRYGVAAMYYTAEDDFRLYAQYTPVKAMIDDEQQQTIEEAVAEVGRGWRLSPYPWAGAVSAHHSFLHVLRFGQDAMKHHFRGVALQARPRAERPPARFALAAIDANLQRFGEIYWSRALQPVRGDDDGELTAPHSAAAMRATAATLPPLRPQPAPTRSSRRKRPRR